MSPLMHLIMSIFLAIILYPFFGPVAFFVVAGGVLIDIDHLLLYFVRFRSLNLLKCYNYYSNTKNFKIFKSIFFAFHNLEFLIAMIVLSFFNNIILFITVGIALHYLLDFIFEMKHEGELIKNYSVIYWMLKKQS